VRLDGGDVVGLRLVGQFQGGAAGLRDDDAGAVGAGDGGGLGQAQGVPVVAHRAVEVVGDQHDAQLADGDVGHGADDRCRHHRQVLPYPLNGELPG
jgi:hypothetical protein